MNCAKCETELVPVSDGPMRRRDDWTVQYDNALAVEFLGGFGMYDDPMSDLFVRRHRDRTLVLCHECADAFVAANPWVAKAVDIHRHSDAAV